MILLIILIINLFIYGLQNIIQDGSWSDNNRLVLLNQGISFGTEEKTIGGNITLNPDNAGVNILNYGGGPGSVLLFGKTNIRFADQRTGLNFHQPHLRVWGLS